MLPLRKGLWALDDIILFLMRFSSDILAAAVAIVSALAVSLLLFVLRRKIVGLMITLVKKAAGRFVLTEPLTEGFRRPASIFLILTAGYAGAAILAQRFLPAASLAGLKTLLKMGLIVCTAWGLCNAAAPAVEALQAAKPGWNQTVTAFAAKIVKLLIIILTIVILIDEAGYNISGLITGLGLGGLTFALAAQDTASNLFGGMVIITDKPFEVGDWIQAGELEGVVESISLRSTRIRTFKDMEIIVPNSTLAAAAIVNCSRMNKRKVEMTLTLTYDTSAEKIKAACQAVRAVLEGHERVDKDSLMVAAFNEFGAYSLDLTVSYFVKDTAFQDFIAVKEAINYGILEALEGLVSFAYPTQQLILGENAGKTLPNFEEHPAD